MFSWPDKSLAKTPQIHNFLGVKMAFIYLKDGMDKNKKKHGEKDSNDFRWVKNCLDLNERRQR